MLLLLPLLLSCSPPPIPVLSLSVYIYLCRYLDATWASVLCTDGKERRKESLFKSRRAIIYSFVRNETNFSFQAIGVSVHTLNSQNVSRMVCLLRKITCFFNSSSSSQGLHVREREMGLSRKRRFFLWRLFNPDASGDGLLHQTFGAHRTKELGALQSEKYVVKSNTF